MTLKTNKIDDLRKYIAFYLDELSHGIKEDDRKFRCDEYINFFFLDLITHFYYGLPKNYHNGFIDNLEQICKGLRRNKNEQIQNNND
jgi:hypothetical protein